MSAKNKPTDSRARRAILQRLKEGGPQDAKALAEQLDVSAMAVRQHLYRLADEKLVAYEEEPRPVGRPAKMWRLTPAADRFFPDAHAELTLGLVRAVRTTFGEQGLAKLLAARAREQAADYLRRLPISASLRRRLNALARIRTAEGYMAHTESESDGTLWLVEQHCPICEAANECQGLCTSELELFQAVLGEDVRVERVDHIQTGATRCAYRICPKT